MRYRFIRFPGGKPKVVTFRYDDGCRQDIRTAKVFDMLGIKGTFNLNNAWIAKEPNGGKMTKEEIQDSILASGHEIVVHGHLHKAPGVCELLMEFKTC